MRLVQEQPCDYRIIDVTSSDGSIDVSSKPSGVCDGNGTSVTGSKQEYISPRENRRIERSRSLLCAVLMVCASSTLLGCGVDSSDSTSNAVVFHSDDFESEFQGILLTDPLIIDQVNEAVSKYTDSPIVNGCIEMAAWYENGLEVIFDGNLIQMIEDDRTIDTARQVVPSVADMLRKVMIDVLKEDPALCSRESYVRAVDFIPEAGPVAQRARLLLRERGGEFGISPSETLGLALDIVEGVPVVTELEGFDYELEIEIER